MNDGPAVFHSFCERVCKTLSKSLFSRRGSEKLSTVKKGHKNGFFSRKLTSQVAKHFISNISNTMPLLT